MEHLECFARILGSATSEPVETTTAPVSGTVCTSEITTSPVPGGRSTIRKSSLPHSTCCRNCRMIWCQHWPAHYHRLIARRNQTDRDELHAMRQYRINPVVGHNVRLPHRSEHHRHVRPINVKRRSARLLYPSLPSATARFTATRGLTHDAPLPLPHRHPHTTLPATAAVPCGAPAPKCPICSFLTHLKAVISTERLRRVWRDPRILYLRLPTTPYSRFPALNMPPNPQRRPQFLLPYCLSPTHLSSSARILESSLLVLRLCNYNAVLPIGFPRDPPPQTSGTPMKRAATAAHARPRP